MISFGNSQSRQGTLYFYNNTCIVQDPKTWKEEYRRVFGSSSNLANIVADNNIFHMTVPTTYKLLTGDANMTGSNNWLSDRITDLTDSVVGTSPGFVDASGDNYRLVGDSDCLDVVGSYTFPADHGLDYQYLEDMDSEARNVNNSAIDIGAFEKQ
ncbi:MAG: hypothetical protein GY866_18810 [Proteobacteria bacterium]|nr:hypothetical protein [Pseudomonadota bacterium]